MINKTTGLNYYDAIQLNSIEFEDIDLEQALPHQQANTNISHFSHTSNLSNLNTKDTESEYNNKIFNALINTPNILSQVINSTLSNISHLKKPSKIKRTTKELLIEEQKKYDIEINQEVDVEKLILAKSYAKKAQKHKPLSKLWFQYNLNAYKCFYDAYQLSNNLTNLHLSFLKSGALWGFNALLRTPTFGINNQYAAIGLQIFNLLITPTLGSVIDIIVGSASNPFILEAMPTLHTSITKEDSYKKIEYNIQKISKDTKKIDITDLESNPTQQILNNKIEYTKLTQKKDRQDAHTNYYQFGSGGVVRSIMGTIAIVGLSIFISQIGKLNGWQNFLVGLIYLSIMVSSSAIDRNLQHMMMIIFNLLHANFIPNLEDLEKIKSEPQKYQQLQQDLKLCLQKPEQIKLKQVQDNAIYKISKLINNLDLAEVNSKKYIQTKKELDIHLNAFEGLYAGEILIYKIKILINSLVLLDKNSDDYSKTNNELAIYIKEINNLQKVDILNTIIDKIKLLDTKNSDEYLELQKDLNNCLEKFKNFTKMQDIPTDSSIAKDITNITHRFTSNMVTNLRTNHILDTQIIKNYTNSFYSIIFAPAMTSIIGDVLRYKLDNKELALKLYIMCKNISRAVLLIANTLSSVERIRTKDIVRNPKDLEHAKTIEIKEIAEDGSEKIMTKPIDRNGKVITTSIEVDGGKIDTLIGDKQYNRLHSSKFTPANRVVKSVSTGVLPRTLIDRLSTSKTMRHLPPVLTT